MTNEEIERLTDDQIVELMRQLRIPVVRSLFATVHYKSVDRPNGFSESDLDQISDDLEGGDVLRWRRELAEHFAKNTK